MKTVTQYRRDREHWSYSSLNQLLNICSLQWAFQRLYKLAPAFRPASMSFGSAFHRTLEWIALSRKDGAIPKARDAQELFTDLWARQLSEDGEVKFAEGETPETCAAQGRSLAACFLTAQDDGERVLQVNQPFCVPLIGADGNAMDKPLLGEMDCLVEKDGQTVIVDWKTAGRRWPKDKAARDLQPTAYLYAAQASEPEQAVKAFRFDVLVKNKTPVLEHHVTERSADQFRRLVALIQVAEKLAAQELFIPAEQGFYCAGCGYQSACKAWHRSQARVVNVAAVA